MHCCGGPEVEEEEEQEEKRACIHPLAEDQLSRRHWRLQGARLEADAAAASAVAAAAACAVAAVCLRAAEGGRPYGQVCLEGERPPSVQVCWQPNAQVCWRCCCCCSEGERT